MSYNYRCSLRKQCGTSKTLPKLIEQYIRRPMCPGCGKDTLKTVDAREKARNKRRVCNCDGIHHPHRKGTEPWCNYAKIGPTEEDYQDRYRNTPS